MASNGVGRGNARVQGEKVDTSILKESITLPISGQVSKNRLMKAPMTERLCYWNKEGQEISARGVPSPELIELYRRWGEGEIGIIVIGNTMVRYDALEAFGNPILPGIALDGTHESVAKENSAHGRIEAWHELGNVSRAYGSLVVVQLSHPGRQGSKALNPNPVSASDVHLKMAWAGNEFAKPRPLTRDEIKEMVKTWGESAYWAYQAGLDGVQVHCAHGYLLAQFLSPTTNLRTDEYGGDLTNRSRIVFEIIAEIRRRVPDPKFIICAKINSVEFQDKGITTDDFKGFAVKLDEAGLDFVDLSGGTFEGRAFDHKKESTKKREAYFIEFAEMIRPLLKKTKVYITGGLRTAGGMVRAVESGACEGLGFARPLAAEPYFCKEILEGRITGALENHVPLPQNTQSSGTQLHQIGHGEESISDWSVDSEVERWVAANEIETQRKIKILPKVDSSGYPPLHPEAGFQYLK